MLELFRNHGKILGMNARNLEYLRPFNPKQAKRLADDKLLCKRTLRKNSLPVPRLIAKISTREQLENFDWSTLPADFALKPNRGFGGEGILVVYGKKKNRADAWVKANGQIVTIQDLKNHIQNILDGSFSLSSTPDIAFFEERLKLLKLFKPYAYKGIPDIRVIVFNKVPVMAMLRLPTKESNGKANLQQGAVGVGIDLANGITTTALQGKIKMIEYVPGTRLLLSGIKIPHWKEILLMSVRAQEVSGLGFLGADVAIDRDRGPVFLELNARPGLSIQLANTAGLKERLERVKGIKIKTAERGVRLGMNLFGGEIEEEVEGISGKKMIGSVEKVRLIGKNGKELEVEAKIDTGAYSSSIDVELARELGFAEVINYFYHIEKPTPATREEARVLEARLRTRHLGDHPDLADLAFVYSASGITLRPKIQLPFVMDELTINSKINIVPRPDLQYQMIVGRQDLKKFLIDASRVIARK